MLGFIYLTVAFAWVIVCIAHTAAAWTAKDDTEEARFYLYLILATPLWPLITVGTLLYMAYLHNRPKGDPNE